MLTVVLALVAADLNTTVRVDSHAYRVRVRGEQVRVFQKAALTKRSLDRRDRMRRAVEVATGCRITDDYWQETSIEGVLDCSRRPASP